ncbi:hypothetical protein JTE90_004980 [Oedothorax gibbosus]|uniref:Histone-lysine N-methyltransferase n=1 Tax=Oedothorax gibbosus TaxID=931172 RepID=A0AAV6VFS0_9ARAC|nr:hypothetical protein JTE90_004980 [Oedothorax gibbosus]
MDEDLNSEVEYSEAMSGLHESGLERNNISAYDIYPGLYESESPIESHCSRDELKNCCNEVGTKCNCKNDSSDSYYTCSSSEESNTYTLLSVKCLTPYENLKAKCRRLGLNFFDGYSQSKRRKFEVDETPGTQEIEEYEAELILDHMVEEGQKFYLIKWKNYVMDANTWEPVHNLTRCNKMIDYYETLQNPSKPFSKNMLDYFVKELVSHQPYDYLSLVKVVSIATQTSVNSLKNMNLTETQLRLKAKDILQMPLYKLQNENMFELMRFAEKRKAVLINLNEWQIQINSPYIKVENNEDLEMAPTDFKFITDYTAQGIKISEQPVVFCECEKGCLKEEHKCCPGEWEAQPAYDKCRRLMLLPGHPIYECNNLCKCDQNCVNRVVQHGQKIKVAIFRTSNGCGWGLKTLETIQKDKFVVEYLGEVLTSEGAEARGEDYDTIGRSYLFDLDYGDEDCKYTVDAGRLGNASHFINHSCEPNLQVFPVWINNQDPNMPRLAFFSKRRIQRGEELTIDYKMVKGRDGSLTNTNTRRVLCKCKSRNCRKYLC